MRLGVREAWGKCYLRGSLDTFEEGVDGLDGQLKGFAMGVKGANWDVVEKLLGTTECAAVSGESSVPSG